MLLSLKMTRSVFDTLFVVDQMILIGPKTFYSIVHCFQGGRIRRGFGGIKKTPEVGFSCEVFALLLNHHQTDDERSKLISLSC